MLIEKAANTAIASGSGTAVYFGLSNGEWQAIGVVVGAFIGIAGLVVQIYFKRAHLRIAMRRALADPEE